MPALRNRRRERFALEIATMTPYDRAYVAAGFSDTPWAKYNANRLAHDPAVAARIAELREQFAEKNQLHAEYLQRKLLPIVEANVQDLYTIVPNPDGTTREVLKSIAAMPRDLAAAIKKIKCDPETGAVTEIDFHGKVEAGNVLLRSVGAINGTQINQQFNHLRHEDWLDALDEVSGKETLPRETASNKAVDQQSAAAVIDTLWRRETDAKDKDR